MNYVADDKDRFTLTDMKPSGARDTREEARWEALVARPHGLHELHQPSMTYASPNARSRLDRIYCNQEPTHYLDYHMTCTALEWCPHLSRHRAISFRRFRPIKDTESVQPLADHLVGHPDWPSKVALSYGELLDREPDASQLKRVTLLKKAMRIAARNLDVQSYCVSGSLSVEDRLGTTMRFIRASERQSPSAISSCISRYPALCKMIDNPYDFTAPLHLRLRLIRQHALELAREHALDELSQLHSELTELPAEQAAQKRRRVHQLIHRLAPGRSCATFAVMDKHGCATTEPTVMASTLKAHWSQVFAAKGTDADLRGRWLREATECTPPEDGCHIPAVKPSLKHFKKALLFSKNSAPGPDGITFRAWRALGDFGVSILYDAFTALTADDALSTLDRDWQDFNSSLLVFLPKKPSGETEEGIMVYEAANTRPLNITNADNRLICSAVRLCIEPQLSPGAAREQRGFIKGRSMLANVIDIEAAMLRHAFDSPAAAAVFFDFDAAFPSVSHDFLHDVFAAKGWPQWIRTFILGLYWNNACEISAGGQRHDGFTLSSGVRQGCPLSPLLFAVLSDVLIRRVVRSTPLVTLRAYADDIAVVLPNALSEARILERIFSEYRAISGLRLHHGKTVWVPLTLQSESDIRHDIQQHIRNWSDFSIQFHATYLGFCLGPAREERSWDKAFAKFRERAKLWQRVGCGPFQTILAYRIYIMPLLCFLAQLLNPPSNWDEIEHRVCTTLFPGPRCWTSPRMLRNLRVLGFNAELPNLYDIATAAKCRVVRWENADQGGLDVENRYHDLKRVVRDSEYLVRLAHWRGWMDNNVLANLYHAHDKLRQVATSRSLTVRALLQGSAPREIERKVWQRAVLMHIRTDERDFVHQQLRRHLDHFRLRLLPGRRVARALGLLHGIAKDVPPRVWFATFRALCNGWVTSGRFQQTAACVFGCGHPHDSLRHYAACPVLADFACRRLGIPRAPADELLDAFLALHVPFGPSTSAELGKRALVLYAAHSASCAFRHGRTSVPADALAQYVREAAAGHRGVRRLLAW